MSVQVPPRGTRGVSMPRMPGPMMRFMNGLMFSVFKNRRFQNANVLLLTTVGARSGQERQATVVYFPDPNESQSLLIVASAGGTATHPGWFFNLANNPDKVWVRVGDRRFRVTASTLSATERESAWQRIKTQSPTFATYETKTDRELPIIRLTPA
jgi:deazaflavin-dependent oxidoreductase (nitroreductase family)